MKINTSVRPVIKKFKDYLRKAVNASMNNKEEQNMLQWNEIKSSDDLYSIIEKSKDYPQIIFKDSTSCGISAYAKERLVGGNELLISKADFNYLDLLSYRQISNLIAQELNVIHQSPQIIVLKDGEATFTVTHHSITPDVIARKL